MSVYQEQQLDAGLLMHESPNDDAESPGEYKECPRWSSLDTINPVLGEGLTSYDLPASDAIPDTTFTVEVDSLGSSYTLPTGSLDPKVALIIAYDLDEPAGIERCNTDCVCNETFELEGPEDIVIPRVHCSAKASFSTEPCSHNEEYRSRQNSDKKDASMKGTENYGSAMFPEFEMAEGDLSGSPFDLEDNGRVSARTMHVTSTPVASPATKYAGNSLDTELTVKQVRHNAEHGCSEYVSSAHRMLEMCDVNNKTKEYISGNFTSEKFQNSDRNIRNNSFAVLPSEQHSHDEVFIGAGSKLDQTYIIGELASSARDFGGNLPHCRYLTSVRNRDSTDYTHRELSSIEKSYRYDSGLMLQQSADEESHVLTVDDSSLSIIDVHNDNNAASFFVTDWPSVLTSNCHDLLLTSFHPQSLLSSQTQDMNSPHHIRIVMNSASSQPDLFTDWSFSSLMVQDLPSFDVSTMNELSLRQHSSFRRFSNVTRCSEFDETEQLNCAGKYGEHASFVVIKVVT